MNKIKLVYSNFFFKDSLKDFFAKIFLSSSKSLNDSKTILERGVSTKNMPWILWKYIFIDFTLSFFITLTFFIVIFIANQVLLLAKNILQINIPVLEVFRLLVFFLPNALLISIPFATLVSCLMSVGGFSAHNEFVAMRSAGISFARTLYPYIVLSILIMGFSFFTNEVLIPWGSINFTRQYQRILTLNPQLSLQDNSITQYQDNIIVTKNISEKGIDGIVIIDTDSEGNTRTITAKNAKVENSQNGVISLELNDVVSIGAENKPSEYNYSIGRRMVYSILLTDITRDIQSLNAEYKSILDLYSDIKDNYRVNILPEKLDRVNNAQVARYDLIDKYNKLSSDILRSYSLDTFVLDDGEFRNIGEKIFTVENDIEIDRDDHLKKVVFYKKIAFPVAILLFVLVAFPIGLFYKRSGKTVGFGIGLILSFIYWLLIIICQSIAITDVNLSPFLMMWIPNFVVLVFGIIFITARRHL